MPGTLTLSTLSDGTNSASSTDAIKGSARAWVNFNGTTSPGTIRASYNVSSVTKNGTGDYTVNFTNALTDANYAASLYSDGSSGSGQMQRISQTSSAFRVGTGDRLYGSLQDGVNNFISVFR